MKPGIPALSLVAISVVFFWFIIIIIANVLFMSLPYSGNWEALHMIPYHLPGVLGLISFAGCAVFLAVTRTQNPSWSLGLPLGIILFVAAVFSALSKFILISGGAPLYLDPGYLIQNAAFIAISLLPIGSALFFWSRKAAGERVYDLAVIALIVGVLSLLLLIAMFIPVHHEPGEIVRSSHSVYEGWYILYLMVGLPAVGALHLMHAGRVYGAGGLAGI
jgi:hypothetical protein